MAWYWIVLIVLGYVLVAFLVAIIWAKGEPRHADYAAGFGIFWPLWFPLAAFIIPFICLWNVIDNVVRKRTKKYDTE